MEQSSNTEKSNITQHRLRIENIKCSDYVAVMTILSLQENFKQQ